MMPIALSFLGKPFTKQLHRARVCDKPTNYCYYKMSRNIIFSNWKEKTSTTQEVLLHRNNEFHLYSDEYTFERYFLKGTEGLPKDHTTRYPKHIF